MYEGRGASQRLARKNSTKHHNAIYLTINSQGTTFGLLNYLETEPVSLANINQIKTELHRLMSIHEQQSKCYLTFLRTKRSKSDQSLPDQVAASELRERAEKALAALREKGRDLTQSYDKSPYTSRTVKRAK